MSNVNVGDDANGIGGNIDAFLASIAPVEELVYA